MMSIAPLERRLDELTEWARPPNPQAEETRRFLAALTPEEIDKAAEILIDAENGKQPTEEDMAFLKELESREPVDLPKTDPSQAVCSICGGQPAYERCSPPTMPICEPCWKDMTGESDGL